MDYFDFDEASIVGFYIHDTVLILELEEVSVDDGRSDFVVTVEPVNKVLIEGDLSNEPLMAAEDGEVISLEFSENGYVLVVEWNEFAPRRSFTKRYDIIGGIVSLKQNKRG